LQLDDSNIVITKHDEIVARTTALEIIANRKTELEVYLSKLEEDLDEHGHHLNEELVELFEQLIKGMNENANHIKQDLADYAIKVKEELVTLRDIASAHRKTTESILQSMKATTDDLQRNFDSAMHSFTEVHVSSMYS